MATISLCMIVRDEEQTLARCLEAARSIADEIIIVDTGSHDRTREIAARYTDHLFNFAWIDDFSAARNYAFSKATMDYILWLDADDLILPDDQIKFETLKRELNSGVDAVMMKYNTAFDSAGHTVFSYYRERLVKRSRGFLWQEPVHEYLAIGGNIIQSDIAITHAKIGAHAGGRNLRIYESLLQEGKPLSPRGAYYYARELKDNGRFEEAAQRFALFLESGLGWREDNIAACGELARCLLELGRREEAFLALARSFLYDVPRAELCCQIGYFFKEQREYARAAFWFENVLRLEKPAHSWGFIQHDAWDYIPSLECAVCYDRLGQLQRAALYNELAGSFKPDSPAVAQNRVYFEARLMQEQTCKEE